MSVLRSSALLVAALVLVPVIAGCGGAAAPGGSASTSTGAGVTPPPASQPAGGGGTVVNPPIADGTYKSGKWHVEITGDVTATLDNPLEGPYNNTSAGTTILNYQDATTGDGGGIVLSGGVNGVNMSSKAISTGGSNVDSNVCAVVVTRSDATGIAGTFDCKRILGVVTSGTNPTNVTVDMKGTFEASR
jgi:hypothetical protein